MRLVRVVRLLTFSSLVLPLLVEIWDWTVYQVSFITLIERAHAEVINKYWVFARCLYLVSLFTLIYRWNVTPLSLFLLWIITFQCLWRHWLFYLPRCFKQLEGGGVHKMNKCFSVYSSTRLLKHILMPAFQIHRTMGMVIYLQTTYFHGLRFHCPVICYLASMLWSFICHLFFLLFIF